MKLIFNFGVMMTILSFLFGCSSSAHLTNDEKIVNQITAETAKKLKQQKNLYLIGTGGEMMYDVRMLSMSFQFFHEVDLKEARELVVYAVREYLADINNNEEVRPYLRNYPFKPENIEILIFFYKPDGKNVSSGEITIAGNERGNVVYYIDDPEKHTIKKTYKETYEEASQAISSELGNLL